jgi:glutamate-1-semialdehyde 2,1-aminomutase
LGAQLVAGLQDVIARTGLPWSAQQLYCRGAYYLSPVPPRDAASARVGDSSLLRRWQRLYFANRGIWDAIVGAGPTVAVPATTEDVAQYVGLFEQWAQEVKNLVA